MRLPAHPGLYDPEQDTPALRATQCTGCGTTYFPPVTIGCEVCGAPPPSLRALALSTAGVIHSVATVRVHSGKDIEAPFTVAEIQLDAGPLIRVTMTEVVDTGVIGRRTEAQFLVARVDDDGNEIVEPRFAVVP